MKESKADILYPYGVEAVIRIMLSIFTGFLSILLLSELSDLIVLLTLFSIVNLILLSNWFNFSKNISKADLPSSQTKKTSSTYLTHNLGLYWKVLKITSSNSLSIIIILIIILFSLSDNVLNISVQVFYKIYFINKYSVVLLLNILKCCQFFKSNFIYTAFIIIIFFQ